MYKDYAVVTHLTKLYQMQKLQNTKSQIMHSYLTNQVLISCGRYDVIGQFLVQIVGQQESIVQKSRRPLRNDQRPPKAMICMNTHERIKDYHI